MARLLEYLEEQQSITEIFGYKTQVELLEELENDYLIRNPDWTGKGDPADSIDQILITVSGKLKELLDTSASVLTSVSLKDAPDEYLDNLGLFKELPRKVGQGDDSYREDLAQGINISGSPIPGVLIGIIRSAESADPTNVRNVSVRVKANRYDVDVWILSNEDRSEETPVPIPGMPSLELLAKVQDFVNRPDRVFLTSVYNVNAPTIVEYQVTGLTIRLPSDYTGSISEFKTDLATNLQNKLNDKERFALDVGLFSGQIRKEILSLCPFPAKISAVTLPDDRDKAVDTAYRCSLVEVLDPVLDL